MAQVREFQPKMVAIRDASKLEELKEAIRDVPTQPEILVGDEGAIEVARHSEVDAVVTGIVGARFGSTILALCPSLFLSLKGPPQMAERAEIDPIVIADGLQADLAAMQHVRTVDDTLRESCANRTCA